MNFCPLFILLTLFQLTASYAGIEAIIEKDDRIQIREYTEPGFQQSVGLLELKTKKIRAFCTATLITHWHAITNGHCVTDNKSGYPATLIDPKHFTFTPGKLSAKHAPWGSFKVKRIETFKKWVEEGDIDYDVALIEFFQPILLQPVKLELQKNSELEGKELMLTGYSSKKAYGTLWESRGTFVTIIHPGQSFYHNLDTLPGTSGSLIRMKHKGRLIPIGIHRGGSSNPETNRAVFFNELIFETIQNWIKN